MHYISIRLRSFISIITLIRSNHRRCSTKIGIFRNFAKFTGKHLYQNLFLNKVQGFRPASLLKKRLWLRCFFLNFAKFLRTYLLQNISELVLLSEVFIKFSDEDIRWYNYGTSICQVAATDC